MCMSRAFSRTGLILAASILVVFTSSPFVAAASAQWYPSVGTTIDYAISQQYMLLDGSVEASESFNVYDTGSAYILESTYLASQFPYTWGSNPIIANNSKVLLRHTYDSAGGSLLNRTTSLVVGDILLSDYGYNIYVIEWQKQGTGYSAHTSHMSLGYMTISLNAFWPGFTFDYPDHVNRSTLIGEEVLTNYVLTSISDSLTAVRNLSIAGVIDRYETLTADREGKVLSFSLDETSPNTRNVGFQNVAVRYVLQAGIPGYPPIFLVIGVVITTVILIVRSKRRNCILE